MNIKVCSADNPNLWAPPLLSTPKAKPTDCIDVKSKGHPYDLAIGHLNRKYALANHPIDLHLVKTLLKIAGQLIAVESSQLP